MFNAGSVGSGGKFWPSFTGLHWQTKETRGLRPILGMQQSSIERGYSLNWKGVRKIMFMPSSFSILIASGRADFDGKPDGSSAVGASFMASSERSGNVGREISQLFSIQKTGLL